jgi:2-polyprenyl-3-methyl-5-hydroxy-6-metoxy-1,4-benzoquinol methylase
MTIQTLLEAKKNIQSLSETVWVFAAITSLAETNGIQSLLKGVSLNSLSDTTRIPTKVLEQVLALLTEKEWITLTDNQYQLAKGLCELAKQDGLDKVIAQLQITFGLTREFVTSARHQSIQPGWHYTDDYILQAQGTYSEYIVTDCIPLDPKLDDLLKQPGSVFLDVGAGVGKISLRLCETYPALKVVAIEPADKPYALAQQNFKHATASTRIELRKIFIEELSDQNTFDAIWFPHVFFSDETVKAGLKTALTALKPGGIILTSALSSNLHKTPARVKQLVNSLHSKVRLTEELKKNLTEAGFDHIQIFSTAFDYSAITAIKPK